jgi:hypothetical protein
MKNKVIIGQDSVKKFFNSACELENTARVLRVLDGKFAPKILEIGENFIEMQIIGGVELIDYLTSENGDASHAGRLLGGFLTKFSEEFQDMTLSDVNFHNFIINSEGIFGFDFEEIEKGSIKEAVIKAIGFARRDLTGEAVTDFTEALCGQTGITLAEIEDGIEEYRIFLVERKLGKRRRDHID